MEKFEVQWSAEAVDRLRAQVSAYRFPASPPDSGWKYGCDSEFLKTLCAYWADGFDVASAVTKLNRYPQFRHRVDDIDLHAVHIVGEAGGKRPLLLLHGWPGSIFEFWDVADALAFPTRYGGRAEDAFDLVIPSLPGFGFSGKPAEPMSVKGMAKLLDTLMREGFGYDRYMVQGGDMGAGVGAYLALDHTASVRALHLNFLLVQPSAQPETQEEKEWQAAGASAQQTLGAYMSLQSTRPTSLAYAMNDNPVAQAAWLVERFHDWSDRRERAFQAIFSLDQLLTDVMIYIMTDAFISATWSYAAAARDKVRSMPDGVKVTVPTAFTAYPDPRSPRPPRSWIEKGYALERWVEMKRGGHFAAMEEPESFIDDIRSWGRTVTAS